MKQAPAWLPYRLRLRLDQWRIERALAGLDRTAPQAVASGDAPVEVHMLLCRRDLRVGVLALKSLLRFTAGRWAVCLSDDGTLRAAQRQWVSRHVPGVRWLSWPDAGGQVLRELSARKLPLLAGLYRSRYAPVCKLLHPLLRARAARLIVLDPDTAFFARPQRLLDFAAGPDPAPLYLHDHQDEALAVPADVQRAFAQLAQDVAPPGRVWRLPHRLFNSGLLAFAPRDLDLAPAERYLAWRDSLAGDLRQGRAAIWFGDWTLEQTCYHVMFALAGRPAQPLGEDYHLGGAAGHVFNHFLRHYLVQAATLERLRELVGRL